jgi:tRNA-Thr(GGU) m(6)t(6)A37 methyltransferase TsaA
MPACGTNCQHEPTGQRVKVTHAFGHAGRPVSDPPIDVRPIGWVESSLHDPKVAPRQSDEGAPEAWLVIEPDLARGIRELEPGMDLIVLTWLDRARRDVLATRPRDDEDRPECGVFSTRSPDRPNPIGLHEVRIVAVDGTRIRVRSLEALDGTPIIDLKPVLAPIERR